MTREEFFAKYGETKVVFTSYYKYCFGFNNVESGLYVSVGGSAHNIYRFSVKAGKEYTVNELQPNFASLNDTMMLFVSNEEETK